LKGIISFPFFGDFVKCIQKINRHRQPDSWSKLHAQVFTSNLLEMVVFLSEEVGNSRTKDVTPWDSYISVRIETT
jgi:hypothetical protein